MFHIIANGSLNSDTSWEVRFGYVFYVDTVTQFAVSSQRFRIISCCLLGW